MNGWCEGGKPEKIKKTRWLLLFYMFAEQLRLEHAEEEVAQNGDGDYQAHLRHPNKAICCLDLFGRDVRKRCRGQFKERIPHGHHKAPECLAAIAATSCLGARAPFSTT